MKSLLLAIFTIPTICMAQVASAESGVYSLQEVSGISTVWASHVPPSDLESGNIRSHVSKIQGERAKMPPYESPLKMPDGVGKLQKNFLIFRKTQDGNFEGVLRYGDTTVPVIVINGSHSMSFIEMNDDASTTYTIHRNVKNKDDTFLVTISATKSTALYVCTWSFAGRARLEIK
jgi:hypothetical protein